MPLIAGCLCWQSQPLVPPLVVQVPTPKIPGLVFEDDDERKRRNIPPLGAPVSNDEKE